LTYNPSAPVNRDARIARTGFWLSLFRFQGATGHTPLLPVLVPGVPKDCSGRIAPPESLLRLPEGQGWPSDGSVTLADGCVGVNAPEQAEPRTFDPGSAAPAERSGASAGCRGCPPVEPVPLPRTHASPLAEHRWVACGEPPGTPHATRCSTLNGLSAPGPDRQSNPKSVRRLLMLSTTACHTMR
jgi:hypothetical protein